MDCRAVNFRSAFAAMDCHSFSATQHHRPLPSNNLYRFMTEARVRVKTVNSLPSRYVKRSI